MVPLTTAQGSFHAGVIAARLGVEGILTELVGAPSGIYPFPAQVQVLVADDDLPLASELLLADEVEAVFDRVDVRPSILHRTPLLVWVGLFSMLAWTVAATVRGF
jgi:hypothetical protein